MNQTGARTLAGEVRALALPAIGHSFLQTLVVVVDRAMLGHHAATSLAAMQIAAALEWSIWSVFGAFEIGTLARVGFHVGARRPERARHAVRISLAVSVVSGLVVALGSPVVISLLAPAAPGASAVAVDAAADYLRWTLGATPIVFVGMTLIATLQAGGDTRTPLAIGVVANVAHVAMNRVLILGAWGIPAMGTRGAGISTAMTFTLEAILATIALASPSRPGSFRAPAGAHPGLPAAWRAEARRLFSTSAPAVLEKILYHVGYVSFVAVVWRLGDLAMAANQAVQSVEAICYLSADGFAIAAASLVAQKLGAGRPREATLVARVAAKYAIVLLTSAGVAALAFRSWILPLFSGDPRVAAAGSVIIPWLLVAQPFMAASIVLSQALRGAGQTRAVLGVSAIGALVVRVAATWLFAITMGFGLAGVWMGSTLDWAVRTILLVGIGRAREKELSARASRAPS